MKLKSTVMELRGISEKISKKTGRSYKVANMEEFKTGEHNEVFLGDGVNFADLLNGQKGDQFYVFYERDPKYGNCDPIGCEKVQK